MKCYFKLSVLPAIIFCTYLQANPTNPYFPQVTQNEIPNHELVVTFDNFSQKKMHLLQEIISGIKGIGNAGYCEKYTCFLLTFDRTVFTSPELATKTVFESTSQFGPRLKVGVSHAQLKENCQD